MKLRDVIIFIAILAVVGIYLDLRNSGLLKFNQTNVSQDTVIVNLPPQTINFPPGQPINIINQPIPTDIDTGAILKAFFRELTYLDSLENDTVKIVLKEVIAENTIRSREINWRLKLPLSTTIQNHYKKSAGFFTGGIANVQEKTSMAGAVGYLNKDDLFIYGTYDPFNRSWSAGIMVPIKKREFRSLP